MAATQLEVTPLGFVADIATRLNSEADIVRKSTEVLECIVRSLGAAEASLWLATQQGLICAARAGNGNTPAELMAAHLAEGDGDRDGIAVRRLVAGQRRLGALVMRHEGATSPEAGLALTAAANILAPMLASAEQVRAMTAEVERRARQVEEERRFLHNVVDSLPVSLYVIDRDYRIQAWNRKREAGSQGVQREQALGKTIFEILHRAPAEKLRREFDEVFRSGRIQQFNMETRATGEARTYRITKIPMQVVEGAPASHVITIGEDVTDLAATQERFAQSEKRAAIGHLAAGVMHEISGPLSTIAATTDALGQQVDAIARRGAIVPAPARAALRTIRQEVQRSREIVGSLVNMARPGTGERAPTDVNAIVEQVLSVLAHQPRFKQLALQSFLEPGLPAVMANPEELLQVMVALLQNAADAMEETGTIAIRSRRGPSIREAIVVEVIDEGHGIERGVLPHIFEPFFSTKGPGRGTGLGLSICHSIITGIGGRIEVDSAVGAGSTFRVLLPEGNRP